MGGLGAFWGPPAGEEYIGHRLLRRLGWRYGEAIGPRRQRRPAAPPPPPADAAVRAAIGCDLSEDLRRQREAKCACPPPPAQMAASVNLLIAAGAADSLSRCKPPERCIV